MAAKAQVYRVRLSGELAARLRTRAEREGVNLSGALALELNGAIHGQHINYSDKVQAKNPGLFSSPVVALAAMKRGRGRPKKDTVAVYARIHRNVAEALRRKVQRSKFGLGEAVEIAVCAWLGIGGNGA